MISEQNVTYEVDAEIDGIDPLEGVATRIGSDDPNKSVILNILNSYTGFFDLFSELIQNALDATQIKYRANPQYQPKIWMLIDIPGRRVRVPDNGVGLTLEQFKYCFRPNVTFKRGAGLRGNKGVGAVIPPFLTGAKSRLRPQGPTSVWA